MYTIAWLDLDRSEFISIYICRDEDEAVDKLMEITGVQDLYEGMSIGEACDYIEYALEDGSLSDLSLTIVTYDGRELFKI